MSITFNIDQIPDLSDKLGLSGQQLLDFIKEQNNAAREERRLEREEAEAQREFTISQREFISNNPTAQAAVAPPPQVEPEICPIKLLPLKDNDNLTAYLTRFERVATLYNWNDARKALQLANLLQGRALEIYSNFDAETSASYILLKAELLKCFNLNEEHYRKEFRSARLGQNSTFNQFATDLGRKFDIWLERAEVEKTFQALRDKMLSDQFLASVTPELRTFIREHSVTKFSEIVTLADNYAAAHPGIVKQISNPISKPHNNFKPKFDSITTSDKYQSNEKNNSLPQISNNNVGKLEYKCFSCGELGHRKSNCPKSPKAVQYLPNNSFDDNKCGPMYYGTVNGMNVSTILRDTGCSTVVVSDKLIPDLDKTNCDYIELSDYIGRQDTWPVVSCNITCNLFSGNVKAVVAPIKHCAVLLGNIPGVLENEKKSLEPIETCMSVDLSENSENDIKFDSLAPVKIENISQVTTRAARKNASLHPLILPDIEPLNINKQEFIDLQQNCPTLAKIRESVISGEICSSRNGRKYTFVKENNLLYRKCVESKLSIDIGKLSLIVPQKCRMLVLKVAHDLPVSGHFSNRKTELKVCQKFWWPGVSGDTRRYCQSCDQCQRMSICGKTKKAPMVSMPIIGTPFQRIAIDLVGKICPPSSAGHQYILTVIDYATSFIEAVPLKEITSISIAEALMSIFSRVGIPHEIISDRGPQFISDLMNEIHKLIGVKPIFTSPYHPMMNGKLERQHSTLKAILRKLCEKKPRDWERYLIPTLFAMRELPSDTTGFSPFELLYGRQVRGPISILHDLWAEPNLDDEKRSSYQYVIELRDRLEEASDLAQETAKMKASSYKSYFDKKTSKRSFKINDEVLLLQHDSSNKLLMRWKGPFKIVEVRSNINYVIDMNGTKKLYHINMLKRYHRRATSDKPNIANEQTALESVGIVNNIDPVQFCTIDDFEEETNFFSFDSDDSKDINISPHLNADQSRDVEKILNKYAKTFSNVPGNTDTVTHNIELKSKEIICRRNYPVPLHLKKYFDDEVDKMLEMGIIQPSNSNYCSPTVMVKKSGTDPVEYRLTQDFRALNAITVFDAEPMPTIEADLHKFASANFISEIDITRAYYQVKLTPESRKYTAFATNRGLMEYKQLPFGLVTACATYVRLMRKVLADMNPLYANNVSVYFDNIYVATTDFETHLKVLEELFCCLEAHNLTAKPSKCFFAFKKVNYLGFVIGDGSIEPQSSKTDAVLDMSLPKTKKELRSFLGFVSFYRKFIPNMSNLSATLSDMLKKNYPEKLVWDDCARDNFHKLKNFLTQKPILALPDINKKFCLRTDASNSGIAAMLFQYHENIPKPVCYASRKLLPRETRYSTIERELLALIWGVQKFNYYLYATEFLIESDHKPLAHLTTFKCSNPRLMRWALLLQPYRYRVIHIPGSENHGPDILSRCLPTEKSS